VGTVDSDGDTVRPITGAKRVYELAMEAADTGAKLVEVVQRRIGSEVLDLADLLAAGCILLPIDHPEASRCWVTGTGLTHLGSASTRNAMHSAEKNSTSGETPTDSICMFQWGVEGGKPPEGEVGVQPEWFYKGDGTCLVAPGQPLESPAFGLDAGEEPEMVGLYVISSDGRPCRVGFALGNEFSDHIMERQNYLYLAHSKIRPCSFGPELLSGPPPGHIPGRSRVVRNGATHWEGEFITGEENMSHSIANLEYHHFKYPMFRQPGDLHCHFMGTATLSFSEGIRVEPGDVLEVESPVFGSTLRNPVALCEDHRPDIQSL
jgi:hypothetical protein